MSKSIEGLKRRLEFLEGLERRGLLEQWEDIQEHRANLRREDAERKRLLAENEKLGEMGRQQADDEFSTKPGAKRKWKGIVGYCLVCAVRALTADGTSQAQAFRDLHWWAKNWHRPLSGMDAKRRNWFQQLVGEDWDYIRDECKRQEPRQLAARHSEALKAWGPFLAREAALEAEMERFRALSEANKDRAEELLRRSPQK